MGTNVTEATLTLTAISRHDYDTLALSWDRSRQVWATKAPSTSSESSTLEVNPWRAERLCNREDDGPESA